MTADDEKLSAEEHAELLHRWCSDDGRAAVNRAAWRGPPLDDPRLAALAADTARRTHRGLRVLLVILVPGGVAWVAVGLIRTPLWTDYTIYGVLLTIAVIATLVALRALGQAERRQRAVADFPALRQVAAERRAKRRQQSLDDGSG